jgi:Flp pilus assembly protein TadD
MHPRRRAVADLNRAIRLSPRDPVAYHLRSLIRDGMGRRAQARADCRRAIDLDDTSGEWIECRPQRSERHAHMGE